GAQTPRFVEIRESELQSWTAFREGAPFLRGQNAVRSLALVKALAREAREMGLQEQPAVAVELERLRGRWALQSLRREVGESLTVTEVEVDAELETNPRSPRPRRVRLRNLFRRFTPRNRDSLAATMESYRERVLEGESFGDLALEVSESETRWRRGLLGNVAAGTLRPDVDEIAQALQEGQVSEVLASEDGLTLLYCEAVLPAVAASPSQLRRAARQRLEQARFDERWAALRVELLRAAELRIAAEDGLRVAYADGEIAGATLAAVVGEAIEGVRQLPPRWQAPIENYVRGQIAYRRLEKQRQGAGRESLDWSELQVLASAALGRRVDRRWVDPEESDLELSYRRAPERFPWPERLHLSVIRLPRRSEQLLEDTQRAAQLLSEIRTGRDFATVARAASDHPSSSRGGQLRGIARQRVSAQLGIDLTRAVRTLSPGEISELISSGEALWIVRLDRVEPERVATWDEARSAVRREWTRDRRSELQAGEVAKILADLEVRRIDDP
ncbi:MAG: peptidylprolyl isomerase, partial [Acidobacteriota bacterium]